MAKQVVPIDKNKKNFTKAEKEKRQNAERALQAKSDKIKCPEWLDAIGQEEWQRLEEELKELGLLTNLDQAAMAIACDCYSKYIQATTKIDETALVGTHTNKGGAKNLVINPYVHVAQRYADMYKKYCTELGLTPAARLKMTTSPGAPGETEGDALIDFIKGSRKA
jgi:P27 family predicted phage terminase small subunit